MLPLCADEGVQTIVYSPLARGRLARPWGETTARAETEAVFKLGEATVESDQKIVEAVGAVATEHGVSQALIALAWLRRNPVVAAPIVGALKAKHIDDAIAALSITLTDDQLSDSKRRTHPVWITRCIKSGHVGLCYGGSDRIQNGDCLTST